MARFPGKGVVTFWLSLIYLSSLRWGPAHITEDKCLLCQAKEMGKASPMETASLVPCHRVCQMPGSRMEIMSQIPKWSKITVLQVSTDLYQPKSGLLISNWFKLLGVSGLSNKHPDLCMGMRNGMVANMSVHGYTQIAGTSGWWKL